MDRLEPGPKTGWTRALAITTALLSGTGLGCTERPADPPGQACSSGWCWAGTTSLGRDLRAVWAASGDDAWAVGDAGTVLRWRGQTWTRLDSGTAENLFDVSGSSASNVWMVGQNGTLLHWDGTSLSRSPTALRDPLFAVWVGGQGNAWAVGNLGLVLRLTPDGWKQVSNPAADFSMTLYAVWGSSLDDVWAAGDTGFIHWDGLNWSFSTNGPGLSVSDIWGTSAANVWASGDGLLGWDGTNWVRIPGPAGVEFLTALSGSSSSDVWVLDSSSTPRHFDGAVWETQPFRSATTLYDLHAAPSGDLFAVGGGGAIVQGRPGSLSLAPQGLGFALGNIWGLSANDIWTVGASGASMHWDGGGWAAIPTPTDALLYSVWGATSSDVWAAGTGGVVLHWNGLSWTQVPSGTTGVLFGLSGSSGTNVWAVGLNGTVLRWNGITWTSVTSPGVSTLRSVLVKGPADVWVVGDSGTAAHWDGAAWTQRSTPTTAPVLRILESGGAVWAITPTEVLRWDTTAWSTVRTDALPVGVNLQALWGDTTVGLWIGGSCGRPPAPGACLYRWDGATWSRHEFPDARAVNAGWGRWALCGSGCMLRQQQ